MLRITIHEDSKVCRLELAGRLEGPWVTETERAWRASLCRRRKIEIDLRQLTGIDNAGRDLLAAIQRAGACLIVEGVWMTALIGELSSQQLCKGGKPQSPATRPRRTRSSPQQENSK
jgi:ABC-type transporter Mla MlaB component